MHGRLSEEFRGRTKSYAAGVVRLYVKLPKLLAIFTTMINRTKEKN